MVTPYGEAISIDTIYREPAHFESPHGEPFHNDSKWGPLMETPNDDSTNIDP